MLSWCLIIVTHLFHGWYMHLFVHFSDSPISVFLLLHPWFLRPFIFFSAVAGFLACLYWKTVYLSIIIFMIVSLRRYQVLPYFNRKWNAINAQSQISHLCSVISVYDNAMQNHSVIYTSTSSIFLSGGSSFPHPPSIIYSVLIRFVSLIFSEPVHQSLSLNE